MSNIIKEDTATDLQLSLTGTDRPLISVIIPTYNRLPLLKEAIASVIEQTYIKWELIIVDDGSTDGTADAIQKMSDSRIRLIPLSHSGHIGQVMNEGVKHCSGEWLAFLDSDDIWLPQKLELQIHSLKKEKKKWCYGSFEYIDENKKLIYKSPEKFPPLSGRILEEIIKGQAGIAICSLMVEKKFFEMVGGFSSDPGVRNDYELALRIALKEEIAFVPDIILKVRDHVNRIYKSRRYPYERSALTYQAFLNLKPEKRFEKLAKRKIAFLLSEAAVHRFANKDYRKAIQQLSQSLWLRDKPGHWLSALKRGIYAIFQKNIQHPAKRRKEKDLAAYSS
ncbi:MAG TPA: glycosyltransferase [Chitinophagaceae bacterium]|nr:glycosyltransferase [Chitinophagaceae bacterium]